MTDIPDLDEQPWDVPFTLEDVLDATNLRQTYGAIQVIESIDGLGAALDVERTNKNRADIKRRLRERIRHLAEAPPAEHAGSEDIVAAVTNTTPGEAAAHRDQGNDDTDDGDDSPAIPGVSGEISGADTAATEG
jgi:hypothetical protein